MTIKITLSLYVILNTIFDHPVLKISYHTDHMNTCIVESWEFIEFTVLLHKSMFMWNKNFYDFDSFNSFRCTEY